MGTIEWIRMWEPIEPPEPRPAWSCLDDMPILAAPGCAQASRSGPCTGTPAAAPNAAGTLGTDAQEPIRQIVTKDAGSQANTKKSGKGPIG